MNYKIYFKFFNKKMKTTIDASNEEGAIHLLRNRIELLKIEEVSYAKDETVERLKGLFGMK